jgi:DNA mismatch repair endonuclease MutH
VELKTDARPAFITLQIAGNGDPGQRRQLAQRIAGQLSGLDLKRDKGWTGILLELWLGASAGSKPEQDFAALGVLMPHMAALPGDAAIAG